MPENRLDILIIRTAFFTKKTVLGRLVEGGRDVTMEEIPVLLTLLGEEGLTQNELGAKIDKSGPNLTRILKRMRERKLVRRARDKEDGRKQRIFLMKKGRDILEAFLPIAREYVREVTAGINADDLATTIKTLQLVANQAREMERANRQK